LHLFRQAFTLHDAEQNRARFDVLTNCRPQHSHALAIAGAGMLRTIGAPICPPCPAVLLVAIVAALCRDACAPAFVSRQRVAGQNDAQLAGGVCLSSHLNARRY
jgi:hypothetical protein